MTQTSYYHLQWAEQVDMGYEIYNIDQPTFNTYLDFTSLHELISQMTKEEQVYFILFLHEACNV